MVVIRVTDDQAIDMPVALVHQVRDKHRITGIESASERRPAVVHQDMVAGFRNGGQALPYIKQSEPYIAPGRTFGLQPEHG